MSSFTTSRGALSVMTPTQGDLRLVHSLKPTTRNDVAYVMGYD